MTIIPKFWAAKNSFSVSLHPIVLRMAKTPADFIACLDSSLHFTDVHKMADKQLQKYPIGKLFNRYENILIPEEGRTMWELKEASQATAFYPLAKYGVITGTFDKMIEKFGNTSFPARQKKPDIAQDYKKAIFHYKDGASNIKPKILSQKDVIFLRESLIRQFNRND